MAKVRWSNEAADWLERIYEHIAIDDPNVARSIVQDIYEKAQSLELFPKRGHLYKITPQGEVRTLLSGHYRIAYLVIEPDAVVLLGIYHGALEIEGYL